MATYEDRWFEVWWLQGVDITPSHLVIVTPDPKDRSRVLVLDPFSGDSVLYECKDYEDAHTWLRQDDYSMVGGREFPDDGWGEPVG
jgi:hypothetical protein